MRLSLKSIFPARDLGWNHVRAVCAQPDCHNKLLTRLVPGSRVGIFVREQWYCSPDCFSFASRKTLELLSNSELLEIPRNPRLTLGLALLTKGFISTDQYRELMAPKAFEAGDLEAVVIERGWVTDKQLAVARSIQWGYPVLGQDLSGHSVAVDLPPTLFRACSATPLYYSREIRRLVLGFINRVDHALLQSIEQNAGCRAEPCFITPGELARQLERLTGPPHYEQVAVEHPGTVPQMARTLGGCALQVAATEASFTRCRSFLWVRLVGNKGTVDVLFDLKNAETAFSVDLPEVTEINSRLRDRFLGKRAGVGR